MALQPKSKPVDSALATGRRGWLSRLWRGSGGWHPTQQNEAYLFLLPSLAGLLVFTALPIVAALALSLVRWNLVGAPVFVGPANYVELLTRDDAFRKAFWNTLYFVVTIVPLQLAIGLALAVALNQALRGIKIYRVIYFMPVVTSIVAAALVFQWMFNRDFGVLSALIWKLGEWTGGAITPPDWLNSTVWAKPAIVLLTLWKNVGFTLVIYLAGLQAVPQELYDAATVDGASGWQRFRNITLPLISPTTFFLLVIQMIGAFQLFSEPFVMSRGQGGPAQATLTLVFYVYQNAFRFGNMGKAAAIAWVLFVFIFVCTLVQNRLQRRWVHYEAGEV
ncbi:MAG TPA: sugar ABC transporter permease [Herpetosiphonaceae bacterium]